MATSRCWCRLGWLYRNLRVLYCLTPPASMPILPQYAPHLIRIYRFFTRDWARQLGHLVELSWRDRVLPEPQATATLALLELIESGLLVSPNWSQHLELVGDLMAALSPKGGWALACRCDSHAFISVSVRLRAVLVHLISDLAILPYFMLSHHDVQLVANATNSDVEGRFRFVQRRTTGRVPSPSTLARLAPSGFRALPCRVTSLTPFPTWIVLMLLVSGMTHKLPWRRVLSHSWLLVIYWLCGKL